MIPYILTNDSLTVIIDGKSLTMNRDNPSFRSATQALQDEDYEKVEQMFDIPKAVVNFAEGNVSVKDGVVTYKGEEVHNYCVDKILQFMTEGLPLQTSCSFFRQADE